MKTLWKVWNGVMGVILALAIVFAFLFAGVRLLGLNPYVVLSGSMEPEYHTGSLIYVKKVDYTTLHKGDVITFMMGDNKTIVTHRIEKVVGIGDEDDPEAKKFKTKGDANENADHGFVHYRNVIGRPVFSIPGLGRFYHTMKDHWVVTLVVGLLFIVAFFVPDVYAAVQKSKQKKKEQAAAFAFPSGAVPPPPPPPYGAPPPAGPPYDAPPPPPPTDDNK